MLFLIGCAGGIARTESSEPPFPKASPVVAAEVELACIVRDKVTRKIIANKCPALFEWLGRLKKLEEQLEVH